MQCKERNFLVTVIFHPYPWWSYVRCVPFGKPHIKLKVRA
jgi:hypothetical protein